MQTLPFFIWFGGGAFLLWGFTRRDGDPLQTGRDNWGAVLAGVVLEALGILLVAVVDALGVQVFGVVLAVAGNLIWIAGLLAIVVNALPRPPWQR